MASSALAAHPPRARVAAGRVLHIAPGHRAGHMRIYHRICAALREAGYDVELMAHPAPGEHLPGDIQVTSLGAYARLGRLRRPDERIRRAGQIYRAARASDAALFHFYAPEFIPWAVALRRATGRPVVFDCMEDFEGYARQRRGTPAPLRRPLALAIRALLHYAARNLDAVVLADAGTERLLARHARRTLVLHNFPHLALFPDPGDQPQAKAFDLTYHGSIPRYHLENCLAVDEQLLARGRQVTWRFIGGMPEEAWFRAELARRSAAARFQIVGLVPHHRVAAEVLRARIGIIPLPNLPKFAHNIPQKLFEFMALRMPVVLSNLPASRPFVGDGHCALMVPPDDPGAYAEAITRLLDDPALCRAMGAEGRRRVEHTYNWGRESAALLNLYAELL